MRKINIATTLLMALGISLSAGNCPNNSCGNPPQEVRIEPQALQPISQNGQFRDIKVEPFENEDYSMIPNSPIMTNNNIITLSSIGMGVAPENTISPAQALALAKRAAIVDAYRQLGEKMYGIRLNAKDTVKDMVSRDTTVKTQVLALIRNAEITETVFKDGLCQVSMELKLDGKRWFRVLAGKPM